jgi:hypothetical protein
MTTLRFGLTFATGLVLLVAAPLVAEDKGQTNAAPPEAAAKAKVSSEATAVQQLQLAHSLVEYGRKNKAPEALITAARIMATNGTRELKEKPTHEKPADAPKATAKDKSDGECSAKELVEEAKKLSGNNPAVVALANSVELSRGALGGPKRTVEVVEPLASDIFKITFRGDEVARVGVSGDGDTRLDLYIYDENGHLVTSQVGPGDDCLASWVPRWTGPFIVKVVNRGLLQNKYIILTN